jgi:hypothetical protein
VVAALYKAKNCKLKTYKSNKDFHQVFSEKFPYLHGDKDEMLNREFLCKYKLSLVSGTKV